MAHAFLTFDTMKRYAAIFLFFLTCVGSTYAQDFMGIRESNYAGAKGSDWNPASIADSRYHFDATIIGLGTRFYNDYFFLNTRRDPGFWNIQANDTNTAITEYANFEDFILPDSADYYMARDGDVFIYDNPQFTPIRGFFNLEIDFLNVMLSLNEKYSIGAGFKQRTFLNIDHVSQELVTLAINDLEYTPLWNLDFRDELLNVSFNSWNEYYLQFAMVAMDKNEHFLKAGGKLKFLQGTGAFYLHADEVDYNFQSDSVANYIRGSFDYGYSANLAPFLEPLDANYNQVSGTDSIQTGDFFRSSSRLGLGIDLGAVYEWRPDWEEYKYEMDGRDNMWVKNRNKYKLRASIAINDIGGMSYEKGTLSRKFDMNVNLYDITIFEDISGFRSFDTTIAYLEEQGDVTYQNEDKDRFFMNLPTHINMDVDYHIWGDFYVNLGSRIGFQMDRDAHRVRYPTSIALTPRWEHPWFGAAVPVSYSQVMGLRAGLGLRAGPVMFGTNDLKPLFAPGNDMNVRGFDFYIGFRVPILFGHPKDKDGDMVSDKFDECIETPGVWAFKGCPDTDGDMIQDTEDDCPAEAGLVEFNGCPDTDRDGIIDRLDDCQTEMGLKEFNGCPDTDEDGIKDSEDKCPKIPGLAEFDGCPDTDDDGIQDSEDNCPSEAGPASNFGCPELIKLHLVDRMGNIVSTTVPDDEDNFVFRNLDHEQSYLFLLEGMDLSKADIQVILRNEDGDHIITATLEESGFYVYRHIESETEELDLMEEEEPELIVLNEEEQEILKKAFDNLEFATAKAIIKPESYESLDELVALLEKKPVWNIRIEGHTDNVGSAANNMLLSKRRAESVKFYLTQRGISEERIQVFFFGQTRPIGDNSTEEGRQMNRRVEMTIVD